MSTANDFSYLTRAVLAVAVAGMTMAAHAGVSVDADAEVAAVSRADLKRSSEAPRSAKQRGTLKCYQEGRLIFESSDIGMLDKGAGMVTLNALSTGQPAMQLIDLKQGFCMIDTRNP